MERTSLDESLDESAVAEPGAGPAIPLASARHAPQRGPVNDQMSFDEVENRFEPAVIEPGRALALADFSPPSVGAGDRLARFAYRLGLPPGALNPFRKRGRTRLTATVTNPLPGDEAAGKALRAGHFLLLGVRSAIADTEFSGPRLSPPMERLIHGFGWLADLESAGPRAPNVAVAERILATWLAANPKPAPGPAWNVGHTGHRLLAWLVHAPLILSSADRKARARVLLAIAETARWLDRQVHKADDKLDEVAAWTAITAAGLLMEDGHARRLYGEAGLIKALGDLVGDDGGLLSRSPLGQIEAIERIVLLKACYAAVRTDAPAQLDTILTLLVPPLLAMLHGDGALGSWQGAPAVAADRIATLVKASGVRTRPLRDARQWGYQRISAVKSILQFDAAPPPLARHARDGCASTLAFELSHAGQRLIVNCGGAAVAGGQIPLRLAQGLRATAAHSTLTIDDCNSTAVLINGKLGAGVSSVEVDRRTLATENGSGATRIEASHDGYVARYGLTHRRILILRDDGLELRGEDVLVAAGRKGKRGTVGVALRFHLGPHIELAQGQDGLGVTLALPDGSLWQFRSARDPVTIEESLWADGQGRPVATRQLVIQARIPRSGESFSWLLKKMR
ncbi:heparinase II/III family protein [Novosphingobium sp.]|uniref:heparinase II/III family protein n=1 Tax=Novosphingobium sp. TaxID=1874826 RepID=UPI0038BDFCC6|nr:heparinase II/III family protein [Pseudomonadota bacterium]